MGLFGARSEIGTMRSLAKEIRGRSSRGSFDGERVFEEAEKLLKQFPNKDVLMEALGGRFNRRIEHDYDEIFHFVAKMKKSETARIVRKRTGQ